MLFRSFRNHLLFFLFACRMSALRNLREVASKQRCNDLCIGQIIAMFLSDPKSNRT